MAIAYGARVGSGHANTNGVTQTVTTSANVPAGSLILVSVSASNVGDLSNLTSVTDSAGNTYVSGVFSCDAGQNTLTAVWYSTTGNALASSSTVTVTFHTALLSSGESWEIAVDYLTGAATTTPTDGTNGKNGQTTAAWVTNSITTTNAADLVWVAAGTNQGAPLAITNAASTPTTGWTTQAAISAGAGNNNQLATGYQVFSATGTYQGGGSVTAFNNGTTAVIIAFKAASGGGGTTVNGAGSEIANSVLAQSSAELVTTSAPAQSNAAISEAARLVNPSVPAQSNSALSVTAQVITAGDTLQSNSAVASQPAQVVNPSVAVQSNSALAVTGHIETPPPQLISNSALVVTAQIITAPAPLASNSAITHHAQIVLASLAFIASSILAATGRSQGQSIPGTVTLSDALAATVTISDTLAAVVTLTDALAATVTISDSPAERSSV